MPRSLMASLRTLWRSAGVIALLFIGLAMALLVTLDFPERLDRLKLAGWWHRRLLALLGLRVRVSGTPVVGAHLSVANHVSWLDIPLMGAVEPLRFVAKSEIRQWPLAGWLATAAGSFYIRRGKGGARPMLDRLSVYLRNGGAVVLFPEGTTTDGRQVLPFHARLFGAAIEAHCPVQPVARRYHPTADGRHVAPFIGDDDLVDEGMARGGRGGGVGHAASPRVRRSRSREHHSLASGRPKANRQGLSGWICMRQMHHRRPRRQQEAKAGHANHLLCRHDHRRPSGQGRARGGRRARLRQRRIPGRCDR